MNKVWKFLDEVHGFQNLPDDSLPEIIFLGRSNVGKSSLINSLTKSKIAKTSKTPGRTRSLIFFELEKKFRIVDFPGYGYSRISKTNEYKLDKLIDQYLKNRNNLNKIFLLIDSRHGFKEQDKLILHELDKLFKDKVFIVFTKKDRIKNMKEKKKLDEFNEIANKHFNKKSFNTRIKQINTIILLNKFINRSLN